MRGRARRKLRLGERATGRKYHGNGCKCSSWRPCS